MVICFSFKIIIKKTFLFVVLGYCLININLYGQGYTCESATPICIEAGTFSYPAGVGSGNAGLDIGCLFSTPNPSWFYLQVEQAGKINIHMWTTPSVDLDFAAWGPFTANSFEALIMSGICNQLTANCRLACDTNCISHPSSVGANPTNLGGYPCGNMIDCSYGSSDEEFIHLPDAVSGDFYILLITNFSNQPTQINFEIHPTSTGSVSCSQLSLFIGDTVCVGETASLTYQNPPSFATFTFEGPNGFSQSSLSPVVTIPNAQLENAGIYTLVITPNGGSPQPPINASLTVKPLPSTPFIIQNNFELQSSAVNGNQWYNQDGIINGATAQNYMVTENGEYSVIVSLFGCKSAPSTPVNVNVTDIETLESNKLIKIFPNPVSDQLVIEFLGNRAKIFFEITNIAGQLVYKGNLVERTVVETSDFVAGYYIIKLENGEKFEFNKIVKQ